ncbi:Flavin-containing monooxygenase FMO GS-OX3 [Mycena sanguinolenta]|uniref:Flavin-containing monooxygenase FMO GS-OX3 n=1 Tax=Mycena sanguinolenta TaxID=230812 RepID=A0A8H7CQJ4_9AGAR|nr:Flavin-containing monooxygenase FMO GS-OX3 [Mycena sanguinolenta]
MMPGEDPEFVGQFIGCDKCERWYHYMCMAVVPGDSRLDGTFFLPALCCWSSVSPCYSILDAPSNCSLTDPLPPKESVDEGAAEQCSRPDCPVQDKFFELEGVFGRYTKLSSTHGRVQCWLVFWKGYKWKDATWEPTRQADWAVEEFERRAVEEGFDLDDDSCIILDEAKEGGVQNPEGAGRGSFPLHLYYNLFVSNAYPSRAEWSYDPFPPAQQGLKIRDWILAPLVPPRPSARTTVFLSATTMSNEKSICIIGAGAAGLAALRAILDTPQYKAGLWKPTVFEERHQVGGVWLPEPTPKNPGLPQTPLYNSLTTNLPHPIMCFQAGLSFPGFPLPPSTPIFPVAAHVQSYLESYTAHFKLAPFIRLSTLVTDVVREQHRWKVQLQTGETFDFDLVIVANGHHRIPRYPNVPGLESWLASKKATHSVWYRHGRYLGDKVLVVGGGPSGTDISAEMRNYCTTLVRSFTGAPHEDVGNLKIRGRLIKLGPDGQAFFEDGSVETDISAAILATGYQVSFPFLTSLFQPGLPPPCPPLPETLYNSTYHLFPLARHIFPIQSTFPPTSLVFMGLPVRVAPLPVMEAQAAAILHAFAHPEALDVARETRDILARYAELGASVDGNTATIARKWSVFDPPDQFIYQDQLYEFAGLDSRVPQWRKDMYYDKKLLRSFWVELERRGEADEWVQGPGRAVQMSGFLCYKNCSKPGRNGS